MGKWAAAQTRLASLFQDRELFLRTSGQVKFLKITAKFQRVVATIVAAILLLWIAATGFMFARHSMSAGELAELARKEAVVTQTENKVEAYRDRIDNTAAELAARQNYLEALVHEHIAPDAPPSPEKTPAVKAGDPGAEKSPVDTVITSELESFEKIRARQDALASSLLRVSTERTVEAEVAIRRLGLSPQVLAANTRKAMGGPLIAAPTAALAKKIKDPVLLKLGAIMHRMATLEDALGSVPTANPASVMMMSSGFGYRSDPFTGSGAMHAGLDFKGPVGTPIMASADGVISFVGTKSGYGNVVEIDHGGGFMTRYAHLSGFDTRVGVPVKAGARIARMGSTGRSTGSHLHFEVRLNGEALDPRKFLEANRDVFAAQNAGR